MSLFAKITGVGSYLPSKILTNNDLANTLNTSDEWITSRSGIKQRHIADENESTSTLATQASLKALESANISAEELDCIIVATTTPDLTFPSVATMVQENIKANNAFAYDIQAVCSGFLYAISIANAQIKSGMSKNILVIGSETFSKILDWTDRSTCVLFGDGAGAIILQASEQDENKNPQGVLSTHLYSDGAYKDLLCTTGGASLNATIGHVSMKGPEVFKHAVKQLGNVAKEALEFNNMTSDDLSLIVPHQANERIITATAKKLKVDLSKIVITVDKHANTSSASVPLALDYAYKENRIKDNDIILLEAFGGGFTWGSCLIRW